jgi:hypothetical protein
MPSSWYSGPLSPQQLNVDLYSFEGTGYSANGILFHAHRTVLHESMEQSRLLTVSSGAGTWNVLPGGTSPTNTQAFSIVDTGALFGEGSEQPGGNATYQFVANTTGAAGIGYQPGSVSPTSNTAVAYPLGAGGIYLVSHFATGQTAKTTPAAIGSGLYLSPGFGEVFYAQGGMQPHTTGTQGMSHYLDIVNAGGGTSGGIASPVANEGICSMFLGQGNGYVVDWAVQVASTASSSDANNFSLVLGTQTVATSSNLGTIGTFVQTPATVNSTLASGEYLSVTAGANTPTSQATYFAEMYGPGLPVVGNAYTWQPAGWYSDGSATSVQIPASGTDTAGFTPRHTWVWGAVSYQGQLVSQNANAYTPNGNITGWTTAGGTISPAGMPGNPPPQATGVLLVPSGSAATVAAYPGSFAASAGTSYQVTSTIFMSAASYTVRTGVNWYDGTGTFLSATTGAQTQASQAVWTPVTSWNTAPTSAATGTPFAQLVAQAGNVSSTISAYIAGIAAVGNVPAPQQSWTGPITSSLMNGQYGPNQALTFLNNPPVVRLAEGLVTSIANTVATPVTFPTSAWVPPGVDTYAAYNNATGAYVAPLPGLYLGFGCFPFTANSTGARYAGFKVTSGRVTTNFQGPAYSAVTATSAPTSVNAMFVFDLNANDTVTPTVWQSSGGSLALTDGSPGYVSRMGMMYLAPYSPGGVNSFTPPMTAFHWYAGVPATALTSYLSTHLGNDLNFLVNRPYFTGYQATAQNGFSNGTWNIVSIDTPAGLLHGSVGDNYGGWSATANTYTAPQPGWYLVMAQVYANVPSTNTGFIAAGINCPTSGGLPPSNSPDQYQTMYFPTTTGTAYPGAAAIGVYWLNAGEYVQPMIKCSAWGGSWGTTVSTSPRVNSQFNVVWMSE